MTIESANHPLRDLLTVMWHYVRDPGAAPRVGEPGLDPDTFDGALDMLAGHRTIVAWPAVAAALDGGPPLPRDAALLTFDDGLADHVRAVVPRLAARGWSGVFFVLARVPGERLTVGHAIHVLLGALGPAGLRDAVADALPAAEASRFAALRERERAAGVDAIDVLKRPLQRDLLDTAEPILQALVEQHVGPSGEVADALHLRPADLTAMRAAGQTIGGHGRRHLWFDHESPARVAGEVAASVAFLAAEPSPWAFAYPYGASGSQSAARLAETAFGAAFHASPRTPAGRFDLGRVDGEDPAFAAILRRAAR